MGKIFCLMGKSSSGKDTIFKYLKEDETLDLKAVVPYTTRPKRVNEEEGVAYHFINKETLEAYHEAQKVIEERVYHTVNGDWHYCTIDDGQINLEQGNYIVISTLEAYTSLKNYFGKEVVIPIYITLEDGERLQRALNREKQEEIPNYEELCRRFLADSVDFSEAALKTAEIEKYYTNHELQTCIEEIKQDMSHLLK